MVIGTVLGAALLFAVASVLQHRTVRQESHEHTLRPALLVRLAVRPLWVAGILADAAGYVLQFIALGHGSLVLVQPLLVAGLLFALPVSAAVHRHRLGPWEWVGAAGTVAGLALFLVSANPGPGTDYASITAWSVILVATLVPAGLLVAFAGPSPSNRRAVMLASATGLAFGLAAALSKVTADLLIYQGIVPMLQAWQTYALVAVGVASLLTAQSAFQAGPLRASLPVLTVLDPVVSIVVGALAFGEGIDTAGIRRALEVVGLAVMAGAVFLLARSPLVSGDEEPQAAAGPGPRAAPARSGEMGHPLSIPGPAAEPADSDARHIRDEV
ncbi:MAG: DMT family transporter [Acidimicrobiales bacterium]